LRFTVAPCAIFVNKSGQFRPINFRFNEVHFIHVHLGELQFARQLVVDGVPVGVGFEDPNARFTGAVARAFHTTKRQVSFAPVVELLMPVMPALMPVLYR